MEIYTITKSAAVAATCRNRVDGVTPALTEMRHVGVDQRAFTGGVRLLPIGTAALAARFAPVRGAVEPGGPPV